MTPTRTLKRALIGVLSLVVLGLGLILLRQSSAEARPGSLVKTVTFRGARFDVVELPLDQFDVSVSWTPGGTSLGQVSGVVRTNAGIFEPDFAPTGLLVSGGKEQRPLQRAAGQGNFYLQPNGVFALSERGATVMETSEYEPSGVREATQSGPLLVRRGELHPKFNEGSPNRALRSGVGVRGGRTVVLAISRDDVNLWTFAALFRDELKCPDALYLDGVISALWAADSGREPDLDKGPFAGVITAKRK